MYEHTQRAAPWLPILVCIFLLGMLILMISTGEMVGALVVLVVTLIVGAAVIIGSRLTVRVLANSLTATFGWGWPRRTVPFSEVVETDIVRNRWWYGFGIRVIPGGTLWNVWGLDAVELRLTSGRVAQIGTDEPEALLAAIRRRTPVG